jgi:hypothetical protein
MSGSSRAPRTGRRPLALHAADAQNVGPENLPDQTRLVDEYFVVFPDQTILRSVLAGQSRYEDWLASAPGRLFRYQLTEQVSRNCPANRRTGN